MQKFNWQNILPDRNSQSTVNSKPATCSIVSWIHYVTLANLPVSNSFSSPTRGKQTALDHSIFKVSTWVIRYRSCQICCVLSLDKCRQIPYGGFVSSGQNYIFFVLWASKQKLNAWSWSITIGVVCIKYVRTKIMWTKSDFPTKHENLATQKKPAILSGKKLSWVHWIQIQKQPSVKTALKYTLYMYIYLQLLPFCLFVLAQVKLSSFSLWLFQEWCSPSHSQKAWFLLP